MSEVKSAMLHEYQGEHGTLIMVTEDYEIHTMTSDENHLREILALFDAELPNFRSRRLIGKSGDMRVLDKGGDGARYSDATEAIRLLNTYSQNPSPEPREGRDNGPGLLEQVKERLSDRDDPLYASEEVAALLDVLDREMTANNRLRHLLHA